MGFFSFLGCRKKATAYQPAAIYQGLRNHVFTLDPATINITQAEEHSSVWGILMETGRPEAVVTLVALGDGTVSLYFSNGGGIIGTGQHEQVKNASEQLLLFSEDFVEKLEKTDSYPLPQKGNTRFYILTFNGIFTAETSENQLEYNQHELSPLFYKAQDLITAIRVTQEQENKK